MSSSFLWSDVGHPLYCTLAGGLLVFALVRAVLPVIRGQPDRRTMTDWAWGLLILLCMMAGRWPALLSSHEFDADESFLFAGAHTLYLDPVLWRSVDGTTTGPFNFIPLWPAGLLFGWNNYLAPHLTALLFLAATLFLLHQSLALLFGRTAARLATLGPLCLESITNAVDLLHYSSELLSIALLAGATFLAVRRWQAGGTPAGNFLAGLALGAVPFAKLQAAPLAACFGLVWFVYECCGLRRTGLRHLLYLVLGAILPLLGISVQLTFAGLWEDAYMSYILSNIQYTRGGPAIASNIWFSLTEVSLRRDSLFHFWMPCTLLALVGLVRFPFPPEKIPRLALLASGAGCLLTLFVIVAPARPFLHYCQFMIPPLTLFLGTVLAGFLGPGPSITSRRAAWLVVCSLIIVLPMLVQRAAVPNFFLGTLHNRTSTRYSPLTRLVQPLLRPGDTIQVWGWANHVNVETGTPLPTKDATIEKVLIRGPHQAYYHRRYLNDFIERMPEFFFDVVSQYSLITEERNKHENAHPILALVIVKNYVLVAEKEGARLYQRKDLVGRP